MFEQLSENASTGDKLKKAAQLPQQARDYWRDAAPREKAGWILLAAFFLVDQIAMHYSVRWYGRLALLALLVMLPYALPEIASAHWTWQSRSRYQPGQRQ